MFEEKYDIKIEYVIYRLVECRIRKHKMLFYLCSISDSHKTLEKDRIKNYVLKKTKIFIFFYNI